MWVEVVTLFLCDTFMDNRSRHNIFVIQGLCVNNSTFNTVPFCLIIYNPCAFKDSIVVIEIVEFKPLIFPFRFGFVHRVFFLLTFYLPIFSPTFEDRLLHFFFYLFLPINSNTPYECIILIRPSIVVCVSIFNRVSSF